MTGFVYPHVTAQQTIADAVGIQYTGAATNSWDDVIVSLAEQCLFDKDDIVHRPARVARAIVEYLDDLVRNP